MGRFERKREIAVQKIDFLKKVSKKVLTRRCLRDIICEYEK